MPTALAFRNEWARYGEQIWTCGGWGGGEVPFTMKLIWFEHVCGPKPYRGWDQGPVQGLPSCGQTNITENTNLWQVVITHEVEKIIQIY